MAGKPQGGLGQMTQLELPLVWSGTKAQPKVVSTAPLAGVGVASSNG
jgi:hypothetical protein